MHRVVGIIAEGDTPATARENATVFLDTEAEYGSWIDWYQGVKESDRWDLKSFPDKPEFQPVHIHGRSYEPDNRYLF